MILDIALGAKEKGLIVIAVTSLPHSSASPARHSSGKRLFEVADIVVDTRASLADASIRIEGSMRPSALIRPASPSPWRMRSSPRQRRSSSNAKSSLS